VTITIGNAGVASFSGQLAVLPGDFNDDGVVDAQDMVDVQDEWMGMAGAVPTIFGDIDGDGMVGQSDYLAVRQRINTKLPPPPTSLTWAITPTQETAAVVGIGLIAAWRARETVSAG
jgi:Dockerin type I domain